MNSQELVVAGNDGIVNQIDRHMGTAEGISRHDAYDVDVGASSEMSESTHKRFESDDHSKKKSDMTRWSGTCLHIILELAECGDVQNVSAPLPY